MATFIVGSIVIGAFILVAYRAYVRKKKGISGCSSCGGCANAPYCHNKKTGD